MTQLKFHETTTKTVIINYPSSTDLTVMTRSQLLTLRHHVLGVLVDWERIF